jgi:hypothetical protein
MRTQMEIGEHMETERDPMERAWQLIVTLPNYNELSEGQKDLQRAAFEFGWESAMKQAERVQKVMTLVMATGWPTQCSKSAASNSR